MCTIDTRDRVSIDTGDRHLDRPAIDTRSASLPSIDTRSRVSLVHMIRKMNTKSKVYKVTIGNAREWLLETLRLHAVSTLIIDLAMLKNGAPWSGFSSQTKLTQDKRKFWLEFCNFAVRFHFYSVWSSVLCLNNLKLHQTKALKEIFVQNMRPRLNRKEVLYQ